MDASTSSRAARWATRPTRRGLVAAVWLPLLGWTGRAGAVAAREATPAAGATRTVEGGFGPVALPVSPRRVVAGYATDMDVALVLDLPLVGGPGARGSAAEAFAPYQPEEALADVVKVTTFPEANFEQIAALQPDCIIDSAGGGDRRRYDLLSAIAPTFDYTAVVSDPGTYRSNWRAGLLAVAEAFGRPEAAEDAIAAYDERAAALRERLAERWAGATFALLGSYEPGLVWVSDTQMHPALILSEDLGLEPAPVMPAHYDDRPNLSLERLDLLDADLLFVRVEPAEEGAGRNRSVLDGVQASPLWRRLPAVAAGNVVEYEAELFYASPLTAAAFLGVVEAALLA